MSLIGSVSGFAAFGVLVRTYALGLQKRPIFSSEFYKFLVSWCVEIKPNYFYLDPSSHVIAAGVFGSVGYFLQNLQERQTAAIAAKKEVMIKNRAHAEELAAQ